MKHGRDRGAYSEPSQTYNIEIFPRKKNNRILNVGMGSKYISVQEYISKKD